MSRRYLLLLFRPHKHIRLNNNFLFVLFLQECLQPLIIRRCQRFVIWEFLVAHRTVILVPRNHTGLQIELWYLDFSTICKSHFDVFLVVIFNMLDERIFHVVIQNVSNVTSKFIFKFCEFCCSGLPWNNLRIRFFKVGIEIWHHGCFFEVIFYVVVSRWENSTPCAVFMER